MSNTLAIGRLAESDRSLAGRLTDWFVGARSHRVVCLLGGLWLINGFDVALTVIAQSQGVLEEANPIARRILLLNPIAILLYKVVLVSFASAVLMKYRSRLMSEVAAGGMLFIYTLVAIQWRLCYELYMLMHRGNIRAGEIDAIDLTILTSQLTLF